MKTSAVVYCSNAGHTRQYAELFGEITGLPVYELKKSAVPENSDIIFFGWIMGNNISGLKRAEKKYRIVAACGVGLSESTEEQRSKISSVNGVPEGKCFYLRGGLDVSRVHGIYKMMLKMVAPSAAKDPAKQNDAGSREPVEMMKTPQSFVSRENLSGIAEWYNKNKEE